MFPCRPLVSLPVLEYTDVSIRAIRTSATLKLAGVRDAAELMRPAPDNGRNGGDLASDLGPAQPADQRGQGQQSDGGQGGPPGVAVPHPHRGEQCRTNTCVEHNDQLPGSWKTPASSRV